MATCAERIGEFVAALRFSDLPAAAVERAKAQMLSVLAAVRAGAASAVVEPVYAIVRRAFGKGEVPLVPFADALSAEGALFAAATASMVHDYDDYLLFGHTGHSAVLVPLLLGVEVGASGDAVLAAQVAANEVEGRLGGAVVLGPHNGQMWAHLHAAGAACAAAKILGLDAGRIADAVTIALGQPPWSLVPAFMGSEAKALTAAAPALHGLLCARLAQRGWTGARGLLEDRQGFLRAFSYAPLEGMLTGLGGTWLTLTTCVKPVPGCAYVDAPVEATLAILARERIRAEDVERVEVAASAVTVAMEQLSHAHAPADRILPTNVTFSVPLSLAICFLDGALSPEALDPAALEVRAADLRSIAARVYVRHDASMTQALLSALDDALDLRRLLGGADLPRAIRRGRADLAERLGGSLSATPADLIALARLTGWGGAGILRAAAGRLTGRRSTAEGYDLRRTRVERATFPFAAEVTVHAGGRRLTERVTHPTGTTGAQTPVAEVARQKILGEFRRAGRDASPIVEAVESIEGRNASDVLRRLLEC